MSARTKELSSIYARYARAYRRAWAPVLAHLARPLLRRLPDTEGGTVVDVACGVGSITRSLHARTVIGADLTPGMLAFAPSHIRTVACDARRSPLRDGSVDLAVCTFALQHVPHAGRAIGEMVRVLRPGGTVAIATWGADDQEYGGPYDVAERVLRRARAPQDPIPKGYHVRVDQPAKLARFARAHDAEVIDAWSARVAYRWTPARFTDWATSMGMYARRLDALSAPRRARAVAQIEAGLAALDAEALTWRPEIVFLLARRPARR